MDKFETELFTQVMDTADDLQGCLIDDDGYSRTRSFVEWRRASKLTRKLTLIGYELQGYAKAKRQFDLETTKVEMAERGIFTTSLDYCVDETANAYKPKDEILERIIPTVSVDDIIAPIYNIKGRS